MSNISPYEASLLKGMTTKLDDSTMLTLALISHTELNNPAASRYFYVGRIDGAASLVAEITELQADSKRCQPWMWKALPQFTSVKYDIASTNARGAKWLAAKLKAALSWDEFCKKLDGWQEKKKVFSWNARYASQKYIAEDGSTVEDLKTARAQLLSLVGQSIVHEEVPKRQAARR